MEEETRREGGQGQHASGVKTTAKKTTSHSIGLCCDQCRHSMFAGGGNPASDVYLEDGECAQAELDSFTV